MNRNDNVRTCGAAAPTSMFCFQCEQTAGGCGCTRQAGVCGKPADVALLQDELTGALVGLARAWCAKGHGTVCDNAASLVEHALFATLTNVDFDGDDIRALTGQVRAKAAHAAEGTGEPVRELDLREVWDAPEDVRSLKSLLLFGLRGIAAYAYHARVLGKTANDEVDVFVMNALKALGDDLSADDLLALVLKAGATRATWARLGRPSPPRCPSRSSPARSSSSPATTSTTSTSCSSRPTGAASTSTRTARCCPRTPTRA